MYAPMFTPMRMLTICTIALLVVPAGAFAGEPVCTAWIRAAGAGASTALQRVLPEVHDVDCGESFVEVRSAGISVYQFGILANPVNPGNSVRDVRVRIPRHPQVETGAHAMLSPGTVGLFLNGVPMENHLDSDSYEGRNLWHYDLTAGAATDSAHNGMSAMLWQLLNDGSRHSPLIGFALDGYPIYGPWGYADGKGGQVKRMRSGYRLRAIRERTTWPDGTTLTPGQYGPAVDAANPLGTFSEDYEFVEAAGDLDRFNGRFSVTPEYPEGTYAYFLASDASGQPAFPYVLANEYYGRASAGAMEDGARIGGWRGMTVRASSASPAAGAPVAFSFEPDAHELEYVHERPIHLIVVSADLAEFAHIHPERDVGDRYRVVHTFAHAGRYRLFAEFTMPGEGPRTEFLDVRVSGTPRAAAPLKISARTQGAEAGYGVELTAAERLRAGRDETLRFRLESTEGVQPYLGAWGHFVAIQEGLGSFIHAHPIAAGVPQPEPRAPHQHAAIAVNTPPPDILEVPVLFPRAGLFKLWAQFQVNGEVRNVPFVVRVEAGEAVAARSVIPKDAIALRVGPGGFAPSRIEIPAGRAARLAVTRDAQPNCASKIVLPDLGITRDLPPGKTVVVELPAMPAKELKFACGMGMYRGLLVVK